MAETLLQTSKFSVERRVVPLPDGGVCEREVVVHPGAAVVLPILEDGSIVMIRNTRFSVGRTLLELPAGTLEPGEPPISCAARELEEETGYRAEQIEPLCEFYTSPGICNERMYAFTARGLTRVGQRLEKTEKIHVHIVPEDNIRQMLVERSIEDGKTIAVVGIYLLARSNQAAPATREDVS